MPGVAGGVPVGFDDGGGGAEGAVEVGDVGHEEEFIGVGFEEEVSADFDLVGDLFVDVGGDFVGELLVGFPEPGVLLVEGGAFGLVVGGPVEVAFEGEVFWDAPFAGGGLEEGEVEVGEEVEAEGIGGADGGAFFGPAAACGAFDVDVAGRGGVEEVLAEFVVVDHGGGRG